MTFQALWKDFFSYMLIHLSSNCLWETKYFKIKILENWKNLWLHVTWCFDNILNCSEIHKCPETTEFIACFSLIQLIHNPAFGCCKPSVQGSDINTSFSVGSQWDVLINTDPLIACSYGLTWCANENYETVFVGCWLAKCKNTTCANLSWFHNFPVLLTNRRAPCSSPDRTAYGLGFSFKSFLKNRLDLKLKITESCKQLCSISLLYILQQLPMEFPNSWLI